MIKNIICILITLTLLITTAQAKDYNTKTTYFIAKKLFSEKNFEKSEFLLKKIISENSIENKYTQKSKILITLLQYKIKNIELAKNNIIILSKNYKQHKEYDTILYLKAIIYFNLNNNYIQKILGIKKYNHDQTFQYKAVSALKKIKNTEMFSKKIKNNIKTIKNQINMHKINISYFYFKKKAYIATIKRLTLLDKKIKIKNKTDYQNFYLLLKSYNELFLDKISEKTLTYLKNYDNIKSSSNLLNQ